MVGKFQHWRNNLEGVNTEEISKNLFDDVDGFVDGHYDENAKAYYILL